MPEVLELVLPPFALIGLGWLLGRRARLPVEGLAWLNLFVLYLALPALLFRLLAATPVEQFANGRFLAATTLGAFLAFALCFAVARLGRRGDTREAAIQGFAGAYGNIGYMGPPLAIAAFGPAAGVPVALVLCLDNALHFTLAPLLMAIGERRASGAASPGVARVAGDIARRILTHPFIVAILAGIAAAALGWRAPAPVETLLASLAGAAAPCALFAMGVTTALRPLRRVPPELLWLVPVKLLLHPLLVYLLVTRLAPDTDPIWLHAAVLLAALPSATNVFVLAQQYGVWEQRASSAVVVSTALSVVTVTGYLYLVSRGLL